VLSYSVALVVIARDEAARIARLLDSVRPVVDRMLVLDTGSVDDTVARARAAGAQVAHFAWCDDFSAARNAALDAAAADWHVVLDADEWLAEGADAIAALRTIAPGFVGTLEVRSDFDDPAAGAGAVHASRGRLSRVLPGAVRYAGRVHEQPQHALPLHALPVVVGHDGYRADALARKRGRNRALLEAELQSRPGDAYAWYQLGKDAAVYDDHARAEQGFAQALALCRGDEPWRHDLVARRLYTLKRLKRHDEGLALAGDELARHEASPDYFFAVGDLLLDMAADRPQHAAELLPMIEQAWRRCLDIGERPDIEGAVAGRGSHLAEHNLALLLDGTGRTDEAMALRARSMAPPGAADRARRHAAV
jgi:glycosyltransferase involved in cell wall biosynthesis